VEYKDYYKTLGVDKTADAAAIKRAYRKLARQYHPDVNPGDPASENRFKDVTEAYEVLSDPDKRAKYDRFGAEWKRYEQAGAPGGPGGFDWSAWTQRAGGTGGGQTTYTTVEDLEQMFGGGGGGFSSFFETLFGGMGAQRAGGRPGTAPRVTARKGQDVEYPVTITLEEAFHGARRVLSKDGRRLEVSIPPGVRTGSRVRLAGEGAPGAGGGAAGDLYFVIDVTPDPRFERKDDDLYMTFEVPLVTAVLGGEVPVPTLDGPLQMRVPPETPNGRRFRLSGKGMPRLKQPQERGDLYVTVSILLPTKLTDEERALFEQLKALRGTT
jgi:curved DNA-binding protein